MNARNRSRVPALEADPRTVGVPYATTAATALSFLAHGELCWFWSIVHAELWPTNKVDREDIPYWYDLLYEDDVGVGQEQLEFVVQEQLCIKPNATINVAAFEFVRYNAIIADE